ncbi:MAG: tripartite tricarboxylate transporter substrate binding protein [Betaproteobacteria bacterium]|jgi:tripartite-type tricarboxylate transporter receptor subunit TctC|nr:tripartite tricarboxylate transporter substrate binding protein [Betaproteobacteria bacterium]
MAVSNKTLTRVALARRWHLGWWCLALSVPLTAWSQTAYPQRPVKLVAPFPPGGTSDVLARVIAQKLGEGLGQPVTVDNKPGAGGNIGHELVAKAPPDGYTLVLSNSSTLVNNPYLYKRMSFDPLTDFAPISTVASAGQVLVVHPSVPVRTVAELTALAKSQPGKLNFGSGGKGIQSHISGEMYMSAVGVQMVHVPYKGTIQAVNDLVTGQLQVVFSDMVPAIPQIKAGKLRALAVTSTERSATLPDLPTMVEAGVPGFNAGVWWSVLAPKGTPSDIITRLNAELAKVVKHTEVMDTYKRLGVNTEHSTPSQVMERVRAEGPQMIKIFKEAGVEPE